MKYFTATLALLAVVGFCAAVPVDTDDDWSIENLHQMKSQALGKAESYIEDLLKTMGEDYCKDSKIDLSGPLQEVKQRAQSVDTESLTVCALVKDKLQYVFEPMTTAIDQCGQEGRLGPVASFILKTFQSVFQYACSQTGEQLLELVNPCLESVLDESTPCAKDFREKYDALSPLNTSGTFIEEVCKLANEGKTCVTQELSKCSLEITRNSFLGLYDAVITPCH